MCLTFVGRITTLRRTKQILRGLPIQYSYTYLSFNLTLSTYTCLRTHPVRQKLKWLCKPLNKCRKQLSRRKLQTQSRKTRTQSLRKQTTRRKTPPTSKKRQTQLWNIETQTLRKQTTRRKTPSTSWKRQTQSRKTETKYCACKRD